MSSVGACLDLVIATNNRFKRIKSVGFVRASKYN
jgi:hypothetical protein